MNDTNSIRYRPQQVLAVGVGALALCGLWAFSAYAEEETAQEIRPTPVRGAVEANTENRRMMREEQSEVRENMRTEAQETRAEMREAGTSPEEMRAYGVETRESTRTVLTQQREVRVAERLEARDSLHSAIADRRTALQEMVAERREVRAERMEERKARLEDVAQNRLRVHADRIGGAMERVLESLTGVAARVEIRIAQFIDRGVDVSSAVQIFNGNAERQGVHELLATARQDVDALRVLMEEAISGEDPQAYMTSVREAASLAKASIQLMHTALRDTVSELKVTTMPEVSAEDTE